MNTLIEPFFYCLIASMIWAPAVLLAASIAERTEGNASGPKSLSGRIWPAALVFAALPVLMAPIAASLGLSLRAPAPLPPMIEPVSTEIAAVQIAAAADYSAGTAFTLADVVKTAAVLYFYGFLLLFALAAARHVWFAYRLNYAAALDEPKFEAALETWRLRIGVVRKPRYVFSHIVSSVCVYGFFRPIVVMPFNLLDRVSIEDAALMGAHEMAHIKRGDVALFALCSAAKAVFWFNPFMHQICARANLAAEQGADALVLASGVNRRQYAQCFVRGLRIASKGPSGFAGELIPSFTPFDKRSRRQRLDAILSGDTTVKTLSPAAKAGLVVSAACATALACAQAAFAVAPPSVQKALPVAPVKGEVSLGFGEKNELLGADRAAHEGIDIRAARGEPVRSAGAGKVIAATDRYQGKTAWGKVVAIDHGHGLITRYAHLDKYSVRKGEQVGAGDIIGAVGSTGVASGPHLHFEIISEGKTIDPAPIAAAAPAQKASTTVRRSVNVAATATAIAPLADVEKIEESRREKTERKLETKRMRLEERMHDLFAEFDAFSDLEGKSFQFNDLELEEFEGAAQLFAELNGKEFLATLPDFTDFVEEARLSDEQIEAIRESREQALEAAAEAMEMAREEFAASREARREALQQVKESARERKEAQREIEKAMREWENQWSRNIHDKESLTMRKHEMRDRAVRDQKEFEKALREAQKDLEQELAEIETLRHEMTRPEQSRD